MRSGLNRRDVLKAIGAPAVAALLPLRLAEAESVFSRMPDEGKDTPKVCLGFWGPVDEPGMRRGEQIGGDHALTGGPKNPWGGGGGPPRNEKIQGGGFAPVEK